VFALKLQCMSLFMAPFCRERMGGACLLCDVDLFRYR
jgi:hypothetical protein